VFASFFLPEHDAFRPPQLGSSTMLQPLFDLFRRLPFPAIRIIQHATGEVGHGRAEIIIRKSPMLHAVRGHLRRLRNGRIIRRSRRRVAPDRSGGGGYCVPLGRLGARRSLCAASQGKWGLRMFGFRPGSEDNNGKPGFGCCPHCSQWRTITDGHYLCRVCEGYEKPPPDHVGEVSGDSHG